MSWALPSMKVIIIYASKDLLISDGIKEKMNVETASKSEKNGMNIYILC